MLTIPVTSWGVDESRCGTLTYSALFTLTTVITFNSLDNSFGIHSNEISLAGLSDTIHLTGMLSSGASKTI